MSKDILHVKGYNIQIIKAKIKQGIKLHYNFLNSLFSANMASEYKNAKPISRDCNVWKNSSYVQNFL